MEIINIIKKERIREGCSNAERTYDRTSNNEDNNEKRNIEKETVINLKIANKQRIKKDIDDEMDHIFINKRINFDLNLFSPENKN